MNKTTVIYHSADFDGIFCREIARKFLGNDNVEYIGWNFGEAPLQIPDGTIYVMDLPVDRVFGFDYAKVGNQRGPQHPGGLIWIDHHKSSIETHPTDIPGYRIDGVAACRLAWQWFCKDSRPCTCEAPHSEGHYDYCPRGRLPLKEEFVDRKVVEPLAVRLAGEYDIWDKRDERTDVFQFGLRSQKLGESMWELLLSGPTEPEGGKQGAAEIAVDALLENGAMLQRYQQEQDKSRITEAGFIIEWEGLKFLATNTTRCNSLTFAAKDVPETGHDALLAFGLIAPNKWKVSLYHANHRKDIDLSEIAKKHGGGGHRGACGFLVNEETLPFFAPVSFQDRVRREKQELDLKREKLGVFLVSEACAKLPHAEIDRLSKQARAMRDYSAVLEERIKAFA